MVRYSCITPTCVVLILNMSSRKWTALHACVIGWGEASASAGNASARRALEASTASTLKPNRSSKKSGVVKKAPLRASDRESTNQYYPAVISVLLQVRIIVISPFIMHVSMHCSQIINRLCVQNYAYVDSMEGKCRTPLMFAAACNLPDCISLLCTGGSNVNLRDAEGNTALHYANAYGSISAVSVLEAKGADRSVTNGKQLTPDDIIGQFDAVLPI
jgi:hypothetical protein